MVPASILSGDTVTGQGRTGRGGAGRGARDVPHLNGPKARGDGGDSRGAFVGCNFQKAAPAKSDKGQPCCLVGSPRRSLRHVPLPPALPIDGLVRSALDHAPRRRPIIPRPISGALKVMSQPAECAPSTPANLRQPLAGFGIAPSLRGVELGMRDRSHEAQAEGVVVNRVDFTT
jgi:hypothetical protein